MSNINWAKNAVFTFPTPIICMECQLEDTLHTCCALKKLTSTYKIRTVGKLSNCPLKPAEEGSVI